MDFECHWRTTMIAYALPRTVSDQESDGFSKITIVSPCRGGDVADIALTARYPAEGHVVNQESEMIVRILEGETDFCCEDIGGTKVEKVSLPAGSTVYVPRNRWYAWEPKGRVRLLVFSTPPWAPEQHRKSLTPWLAPSGV